MIDLPSMGRVTTIPVSDTADSPDLSVQVQAINEPFVMSSPRISEAYRFWFDNPALNYGHALRVGGGTTNEVRFHSSEQSLSLHSPSLRVTYSLPATAEPQPGEVSAPGVAVPFELWKQGADLGFSFEDVGPAGRRYSVYEGAIGNWYSHDALLCHGTPTPVGVGALSETLAPGGGSTYYLVTASGTTDEGRTGSDSFGTSRDATDRRTCAGTGCP